MLRPIVQGSRVEIGARRPNHRVDLGIKANLTKGGGVTEWTEKLALKDRPKVDGAAQPVVEAQEQGVRGDVFERSDAINGMVHNT